MALTLPDCTAVSDLFALSAEERRELVRRIAQDGPSAIDAFIKEREAQDSTIARRVAKLREELLRRAEDLKRKLLEDFGHKRETIEEEYRARLATLESERAGLQGELSRLQGGGLPSGDIILLDVPAEAPRVPWWRRALAWLLRALRLLLWPIRWLVSRAGTRGAARRRTADRIAFASPALDRAGDLYLADAKFRARVKQRLRAAPPAERVKRAWERLLGLEDYETLARKAMAQMMEDDATKRRDERASAIEQQLGSLLQRERGEEARLHQSEAELRAQEAAESRALEEALRNQPEKEVKEAIVDELKAAGLLRESAGGLSATLALMDRFSALVYEDESRSMGSRGGAPTGEYAEGEGHYIRGPMRTAVEISRMDIPASLLRARSRHPKVRHLTDDDVVVYREERASALHVILIVDRSGSMEENGRMDAAKRAALALHHAVRARNPRNRVDLLLMDTSVKTATLRDVWETEPRGFTNHGAALRLARETLRRRRSDRALVYVITDGLPEAYTKDGEDLAGHPDRSMQYAKEQARLLRRERAVAGFVMLLLEPKDERYVNAARELAKEAGGRVMDVDPQALAATLLRTFEAPASEPSLGR